MTTPPPDDGLDAVRAADEACRRADEELTRRVLAARSAGSTWQEVGDVLGVSRQAAFKRFGRPLDPETGRVLATGRRLDPAVLADEVLRDLAAGDVDAVHARMTQACARSLTRRRLLDVWRDVLASVGELERLSGHESRDRDGRTLPPGEATGPLVARVLLHHEAGDLVAHVSVNRAGRIDGLVLGSPAAESDLPF